MGTSRLETKVGLFVLVALALLAALLVQFSKNRSLFQASYELRLHAANVGGLKQQASVLLAGVQVGSVSGIQLAPDGRSVTIFLRIRKAVKIYHDARFVIEQAGFLGDQFVAILPTANEPPLLHDGDEVPCEPPFNLQETARAAAGFIQRIDATARQLDAAVTDLRQTVLNGHSLTNIAVAVDNMRSVSDRALDTINDINSLVASNGSPVSLAVSNVLLFSQDLTRLATNADNLLQTNGPEINLAVKNIRSSTETLKDLLRGMQSGKGLAGAMLQNEPLSTNVQAIAYNLAVASSNLNRLGLWRFLWHRESPSTNAPRPRPPRAPIP
ncbi:MAG: MCE family protein [Verrucomicrobiota bacterium]|nr:MCE family protein [Verrucomicrobiota bacterium]